MHRRPAGSGARRRRFFPGGILAFLLTLASCATQPSHLIVLPDKPMSKTFIPSYPSVETVFKTDDHLEIVVYWAQARGSARHDVKWEMIDAAGGVVFSDSETLPIRKHMYYAKPVDLNKAGIRPGAYTLRVYQDGKPFLKQSLTFSPQEALNRGAKQVVVLPFTDRSKSTNMGSRAKVPTVNTVSHAFYCHVKRHFGESVPHSAALQELGGPVAGDCLNRPACRGRLERAFGPSLFLTGSILLRKNQTETARLEVQAYNSVSGVYRVYASQVVQRRTYNEVIRGLIRGVLREEGLVEDLRESRL